MPTSAKKNTKAAASKKPTVKVGDLKPSKDAKGGARHAETNRPGRKNVF